MTKKQKEFYLLLTGKWRNPRDLRGSFWYYKGGSWLNVDEAYEMEISGVYYDGRPFYNSIESD